MSNPAQKTILLVEDELLISSVEAMIISEFGYNVITAHSGEKAVSTIKNDKTISLILMDIDLGKGINGPEAARQILALRNIPIVFLTSHSEKEYVDKVKKITRYGYVIKNSGNFVLQSSIEMAYELFEAHENIKINMNALKKSEERFRHLSDLLPETIFETDITGKLTFVNQFGLKVFGYSHEDVAAELSVFSLVAPDDHEKTKNRFKEIVEGQESAAKEYRLRRKSGEIFPAILHASAIIEHEHPSGIRGIVIDITAHKKSEEKLMESQALYSSLVDQLPAGVFVKNYEGRYIFVNSWFCKLKKMKTENFIGKTPDDIAAIEKPHQGPGGLVVKYASVGSDDHKLILQNKKTIEYEEIYTDAEGRDQHVYVKKIPIFDSNKNVIGTQGILFDITKLKHAEEKIKTLLAEKEVFIKEVHHRVKNNMSTVISLLSLQANSLKDPPAVEALEVSKNRVRSMMLLYDKLYRSENFREMSAAEYLPPLIDEIISNFSISTHINVEKNINDFILDAKVFLPLGIIINELITNTLKYSFAGREQGLIRVCASKNGNHTLTIEDNGIGLPESVDIINSTGFGLRLVGMLTQQIGGTINIERNNGTKFTLEFN